VALLVLMLAGCKKPAPGQDVFDKLIASDMGIGLTLGMSPDGVHVRLGAPSATVTRQGGARVEDYYLPAGVTDTSRDTPQLSLVYLRGKLMRLYNRWYPGDASRPAPPFFIAPLAAVKLGARRGDLVAALGIPGGNATAAEWRFSSEEGKFIGILAQYASLEGQGTDMCSSLTVIYGEGAEEPRGEEMQRPSWRELGKPPSGAGK
jgi:hypothetical protein